MMGYVQEILEKFEFFPIKCRVQRAAERFEVSQGNLAREGSFWVKAGAGKTVGLEIKVIVVLLCKYLENYSSLCIPFADHFLLGFDCAPSLNVERAGETKDQSAKGPYSKQNSCPQFFA